MISLTHITIDSHEPLVFDHMHISDEDKLAIIADDTAAASRLCEVIAGKRSPRSGERVASSGLSISLLDRSFQSAIQLSGLFSYHQQRYESSYQTYGPTVLEYLRDYYVPIGTIDPRSIEHIEIADIGYSQIEKYAKQISIDHLLQRRVISLSSGESRKVNILKSLIQEPDLIIMDQPYVGLDEDSRHDLKNLLDQLIAQGMQIVISISRKENIPSGVNRLIICEKGGISDDLIPPFDHAKIEASIVKINTKKATNINVENIDRSSDREVLISLSDVSIRYSGSSVLQDISWQVCRGDRWRIKGNNGSGKTTLLSMVSGDHPQSFSTAVRLFGKRRGPEMSLWQIKKHIAHVSPEIQAYTDSAQRVAQLLRSSFISDRGPISRIGQIHEDIIAKWTTQFGIAHLIDQPLYSLSLLQLKRVLLTRAMLNDPEIIILDELCQGLESQDRVDLLQDIEEICDDVGLTVLYVSHYDDESISSLTHELTLDHGRIVSIRQLLRG